MALSNIGVPHQGLKLPSNWGRRSDMVKLIKNGWAKYGKYFQQAAQTSNIPVEILLAFAAVESGINPSAATGATTGMMQWNRNQIGRAHV